MNNVSRVAARASMGCICPDIVGLEWPATGVQLRAGGLAGMLGPALPRHPRRTVRRFTQLFQELDGSNRTLDKVDALRRYFREAQPASAAWALWFLMGQRFPAVLKSGRLRTWAGEAAGLPDWLVEACHERVGDSAETAALLLQVQGAGTDLPLEAFIEAHVRPLRGMDEALQRAALQATWAQLDAPQCLVFHKLITGGFRVGVSKGLVLRGLAAALEQDKDRLAHRLMGDWQPSAQFWRKLTAPGERAEEAALPYPFYLASPIEAPEAELGALDDWLIEWKWDGIRAQLLRRAPATSLWSRGEELVTEAYPEVVQAAGQMPEGTVLDGELLCWAEGAPLGFNLLQRRISRKRLTRAVLDACPVAFLAYDVLEFEGRDLRERPQSARRERLEALAQGWPEGGALQLSPLVEAGDWSALSTLRQASRHRGVEGLMLKHRDGVYRAGRVRGGWWKWKVEPFVADLVMVYAQAGSGRRAAHFTDYTLAAWDGDRLVPVAKAYSGLTDAEIREVDRWIKRHTLGRSGPVRTVEPLQVFEIAFEGIRESDRHQSGLAVRFPRIHRWRKDKPAAEADTLERLRALLPQTRQQAPAQAQGEQLQLDYGAPSSSAAAAAVACGSSPQAQAVASPT